MANLNKEMIQSLILLSRIKCTEEEQGHLLEHLKKILTYFELLDEIDTENVTPCNHVLEDMANVMREDVVGSCMPREVFLANAPSKIGGMIRIPPVISKEPENR